MIHNCIVDIPFSINSIYKKNPYSREIMKCKTLLDLIDRRQTTLSQPNDKYKVLNSKCV